MSIDELVDEKVKAALAAYYPETPESIRMARGVEVQDLAAKSGVSEGTIYRYENGTVKKPSAELVSKLAAALGVSRERYAKSVVDVRGRGAK